MPGPNFVLDKGYFPDAATNQFKCQKAVSGATNQEHCTEAGAADQVLGVIQETVTAGDVTNGRVADVRLIGISRCIASAAIANGARVIAAATGKVVTATASTAKQAQVGIALTTAAADGDHIDILLTPGAQIDT